MSTFLVKKESIEKIVVGLNELNQVSSLKTYIENLYQEINNKYDYDINCLSWDNWFNKICSSLWQLNLDAVNIGYNEKECELEIPDNFFKKIDFYLDLKYENNHWNFNNNIYQLAKNIQCYLYQCCEGIIPNSEIYKALESILTDLLNFIVKNNDEYEKAKWE